MRKFTTNEDIKASKAAIEAGLFGWVAVATGSMIVLDLPDALFAIVIITVATIGLILAEVL